MPVNQETTIFIGVLKFSSNTSQNISKHQARFTMNTKAPINNMSSSERACSLLVSGGFSPFHKGRGVIE